MASIFTHTFDEPLTVRRGGPDSAEWQALQIETGNGVSICLSHAEAQQLIADLSREVAAAEAEVRGAAA